MALAQSMALPPPRAISKSGSKARSRAVPSAASYTVGSGCTLSKTSDSVQFVSVKSLFAVPLFAKKGTVTRNTRFAPMVDREPQAPGPAKILVLQENSSKINHRLFKR